MSDDQDKPTDIDLTETETAAAQQSAPDGATPAGSPKPAPPPTPEERIAALEAEKAELRERMLRIAADFDNWKKRARKEQADAEARVREAVLRDFLEIADNLDRAAASFGAGTESDAKSIRDGVDLVLRQFRSKLERYQVTAVEAVGQPFDPRYHEAISQIPTPEAKPGSVVQEFQKGYRIGERLLRPALVVVAAPPPPPAAPDEGTVKTPPPATEGED
jgi:molecular chaperone GrpE